MATATVTSKGQITIPAAVRLALSLDAGSRIEFVELGDGRFAIVPVNSPVRALKGMLRKLRQVVSVRDMEQAIAKQGAKAKGSGWIPTSLLGILLRMTINSRPSQRP